MKYEGMSFSEGRCWSFFYYANDIKDILHFSAITSRIDLVVNFEKEIKILISLIKE